MGSLKDALVKAGLKPSKTENERPKYVKGPAQNQGAPKKIHSHQASRNFCEVCERTQPDVEYYKHRNPTVTGNWICIACADKNEIPDSTRTTAQSDMCKKKMFRRFFGATNTSLRPEGGGEGR